MKHLIFWLSLAVKCALTSLALGQEPQGIEPRVLNPAFDVPQELRQKYRNPDGSCVQCSIGMCGVDQNVPAAALLLWRSEYGPPIRGGSGPGRVAAYCRDRNIRAYNITGRDTFDWMKWACATGRGAAIGAARMHFQTLVDYDPAAGIWFVCNNNGDQRIERYTESQFRQLHLASGQWVVILDYPPRPARAKYVKWW